MKNMYDVENDYETSSMSLSVMSKEEELLCFENGVFFQALDYQCKSSSGIIFNCARQVTCV